jgi:hypothetical protein
MQQLLFSESVLTALALFGPFPPQLLNWVAQYPPRLRAGLRPPFKQAAVPEFATSPVRVPRRGPVDLSGLYAQLPELEDGATEWAFAFPEGTCLYQLEAAARLCQLSAAAGWRVVQLLPQSTTLTAWLRFGRDYAQVVLHLYPDGRPFWGEVVAAGSGPGAEQVRALLTRI